VLVVELAGLQAVVELAEKSVEQVPLGLAVPVSDGAATIVVPACVRGVAQRGQRPDRADRGETPIFDMPAATATLDRDIGRLRQRQENHCAARLACRLLARGADSFGEKRWPADPRPTVVLSPP